MTLRHGRSFFRRTATDTRFRDPWARHVTDNDDSVTAWLGCRVETAAQRNTSQRTRASGCHNRAVAAGVPYAKFLTQASASMFFSQLSRMSQNYLSGEHDTDKTWCIFFELVKTVTTVLLRECIFSILIKKEMEMNLLRGILSTITFFGTAMDVRSCFFSPQHSLLTSFVFLTIHDTLLIARGQRTFFFLCDDLERC